MDPPTLAARLSSGLRPQDVTPQGSNTTLAAGSFVSPGDPVLVGLPPDALLNQCSPSPFGEFDVWA